MALATQCPHCHTRFRVASDQLKLRGGIVRCGACQSIFDGSAHLIDLDAQPAPTPATAPSVPSPDFTQAAPPSGAGPHTAADDAQPAQSHGAPQVWRTAARAAPADDTGDNDADTGAGTDDATAQAQDAAPQGDPVAAAAAKAELPGTMMAAAATPEPARPAAGAHPGYAPAGRVEPRLEGLQAPREEAPEDALPEPAEPASPPPPAAMPAHGYAPAGRVEPHLDLAVDEEIVAQPLPYDDEPDEPEALDDAPPASATTTDAHEQEHEQEQAHEHQQVQEPPPAVPPEPLQPLEPPEPSEPSASPQSPEPPPPAPIAPQPADDVPSAALPLRASVGGDLPAAPPAAAAPRSARAKAADARTRRSSLKPTKIEAPRLRVPQDDADEPEFVKRGRRQERTGKTRRILMGTGTAVLALALAGQLVHEFRNVLAARNPALKPVLGAACALAGCRVELPAQVDNLAIETGELATLGPDTYSLNTLLRNQGSLVQAWPSIELELTDDANKPVLRRVFAPAEYLPAGVPVAAGFGARTEQPVRLHFALADVKPSDYHLFVFYP